MVRLFALSQFRCIFLILIDSSAGIGCGMHLNRSLTRGRFGCVEALRTDKRTFSRNGRLGRHRV